MDIKEIRDWAISLHGDQKYGNKNYIYHLDLVYELAKEMGMDDDYLVAAYLHDTLEDTNLTKEELFHKTNAKVLNLVWAVTGVGENRQERKNSMLEKLAVYPEAIDLKMLDRYINIKISKLENEKLFKMYVKEMDSYSSLFSLGNQKLYNMILELCDLSSNNVKKLKM